MDFSLLSAFSYFSRQYIEVNKVNTNFRKLSKIWISRDGSREFLYYYLYYWAAQISESETVEEQREGEEGEREIFKKGDTRCNLDRDQNI